MHGRQHGLGRRRLHRGGVRPRVRILDSVPIAVRSARLRAALRGAPDVAWRPGFVRFRSCMPSSPRRAPAILAGARDHGGAPGERSTGYRRTRRREDGHDQKAGGLDCRLGTEPDVGCVRPGDGQRPRARGRQRAVPAAPASPVDQTKVPHYFGPYPNWANSPLTLPDATVTITGDGTGATAVATVGANGAITDITLTDGGQGYSNAKVDITGSGTGAHGRRDHRQEGRCRLRRRDDAGRRLHRSVGDVQRQRWCRGDRLRRRRCRHPLGRRRWLQLPDGGLRPAGRPEWRSGAGPRHVCGSIPGLQRAHRHGRAGRHRHRR